MQRLIRVFLLMWLMVFSVFAGGGVSAAEEKPEAAAAAQTVSDAKLAEIISNDDVAALRDLLAKDTGIINRKINGSSLLHLAIQDVKPGVFALLINDGADVNVTDGRGRTPLILCAQRVMPVMGKMLLETGKTKVYVEDDNKRTAMSYVKNMTEAEAEKRIETYKLVITLGYSTQPIKPEELLARAKDFVDVLSKYEGNSIITEDLVMGWVPESLKPLFQKEILDIGLWRYVVSVLIILLILFVNTVSVHYLKFMSKRYDAKEEGQKRSFVGMTILSARRAFKVLTWGFGVYFVIALLMPQILESAHWATEVISSISVALFIYDFTAVLEYYLMEWANKTENTLDDTLVMLFRRSMRIAVVIMVSLHVYHAITSNPITGVLAGLGIGSMAIALAATDTLKNLIGFFMIIMDKPFTLGERIMFDGHDGVVENIGMRTTRIRRLDGHEVSIPNSKAVDSVIHNIGRRGYLKRSMGITITYDTPLEKVRKGVEIMREILKDHEGMNPNYPPRVYFTDLNADNLNIQATYWFFPPDWYAFLELNEKVNFELMRRYAEEGIEFAFPTQTVYLADDPNRRPVFTNRIESGHNGGADMPVTNESDA